MVAKSYEAREMEALKSTLTPEGWRKVGRTLYKWSERADVWLRVTQGELDLMAHQTKQAALETAAKTAPWHEFVCAQVVAAGEVQGHSLRPAGELWELCYMGAPQFAPMTASTAYSWLERLPLVSSARKADHLRIEILSRA
jgi:hypothetical protein